MKKRLFPLFIILAFSTVGFSQLGIKAGVNLSTLYSNSEDISDKQAAFGYQAGLNAVLPHARWATIFLAGRRGIRIHQ